MEWLGPQYDIELSGVKLRCHANDNLTEKFLIVDRSFHDRELERIVDVLKPGDSFVDVRRKLRDLQLPSCSQSWTHRVGARD